MEIEEKHQMYANFIRYWKYTHFIGYRGRRIARKIRFFTGNSYIAVLRLHSENV